ncbi:GntR family transcriptional regulator [Micromonospora sp. WMMD1102]|uniref:GntR family transcriptional regulator n=1 Tax=Micromonospora sp. WMMD1102 TaxID=3016105 RepID=UPI002414F73E|nr:GntR family transcriptional regulator [Micromonospora sp. WMMD1102]MDG4791098.1 GntR family transcriptional regulator [Micromonospora sp. WMMD1102]
MATKYDRIAADLRAKIRDGDLAPGEQMPAETALKETYRVSLVTMRRALDLLAAEGLIEKRHGHGTFVRIPRQHVKRTSERHQWEKDRALLPLDRRYGTGSTERDTGLEMPDLEFHAEYNEIIADQDLAKAFGVPTGTRLLERTYRTRPRSEPAPFGLGHSYLLYDMVAVNPDLIDVTKEPWPGGTQHQLFTIGIELDRIVEEVTARPPSADEAEELGIDVGVAVLVLRKTSIDTDGRVVEVSDSVLAGDRTQLSYTIELKRWPLAERRRAEKGL